MPVEILSPVETSCTMNPRQFCAVLLFLWTPVSAKIPALVLQLCEQNKLKLKSQ